MSDASVHVFWALLLGMAIRALFWLPPIIDRLRGKVRDE
jgi:hypothetical protein